jgi:hypothetical protein
LKRTGWKTPFVEGISALITSTKYAIDNILKYLSWLTFPFVLLLVYLSLGPQNVMGLELDLGTQIFCFSLSGLHVVFREFSKFSSLVYALNIGEVYCFDPGSLRKKFLLSNLMLFIFLLFLTAYSYQVITLSGTTNSTFYFDLKYWIAPISFLLLWSIISTVTESLSYFVFELSKGKRA